MGLLLVGYLYNILNSRIEGNIEEGIFGRNGISGLIFYVLLIYAVSQAFLAKSGISPVLIYVMAGALALMVFKQPLAKKLQKADSLYEGSPTDYYIEEGFGIIGNTFIHVIKYHIFYKGWGICIKPCRAIYCICNNGKK